jgi:hypothetical protein
MIYVVRELLCQFVFKLCECVSHLPAYLPRRVCNMVTPSLLRSLNPGCLGLPGFFLRSVPIPARLCRKESLQHFLRLFDALTA